MKQPSTASHQFSQVPTAEIPRSSFDRSHGHKTTFDAGFLIPVFIDEALPGDTFNCSMTGFTRLATPIHPFMDNLWIDSFYFAVPIRLLFDNWQKMNGEQENPGDSIDFTTPMMTSPGGGYASGSMSDYFGIPTDVPNLEHSVLWHRAYNLIYNEWFRDQNLQDSIIVNKDDGPDSPADYVLKRRGKRHDYFTSALPWPQKGPAVNLPLGDSAPLLGNSPVHGLGKGDQTFSISGQSVFETETGSTTYLDSNSIFETPDKALYMQEDPDNPGLMNIRAQHEDGTGYADLSNATAATINQLRQAFQIQKLFERDARGGTRYVETIKSHFGVVSADQRLQRPEYLGGGSTPVNIAPVAQTSSSDDGPGPEDTPQGNLAAYGTATLQNHSFTKSFTEHCVVIGLVSCRADLTYQQGLPRMFSRQTRFDYYWPALSHIGEQTILNKEIYAQGTETDEEVFGYQERNAEYRYKNSTITGQFRSTHDLSLDTWHLSQEFDNLPTLSSQFIEENPPVERVIAVPSEPHFLFDSWFRYTCARPMPVNSVPGLIDHF